MYIYRDEILVENNKQKLLNFKLSFKGQNILYLKLKIKLFLKMLHIIFKSYKNKDK